jgi:Flp pilus assembly protein TadD
VDSFDEVLKLAFELHNAGRQREAEALCRVLLRLHAEDPQLLFLLGMVLHKKGQDEEAIKWLSLAAEKQPGWARIFNGLGCAFQRLKNHSRAVENFSRALELEGPTAATCYNLGNSCYQLGDLERAAGLFRQAVELTPNDSASWNNLGKCLNELNRLEESVAAYDRALAAAPDYPLARYGRALSLLAAGRLAEGFRDYESRWQCRQPRQFSQPAWQGQTAPEKTLFLHAEQGYGDAIQMARFIPLARRRVGRVILECRPELKTLFLRSATADSVIAFGDPIPSFDFFLPQGNLPGVLGITLDTIPNQTPYLKAPPGASLPPAPAGSVKVGLVWAGNPEHHQDAARSIPLEQLAPLLQTPGVVFYSLQVPVPPRDEPCFRSFSNLVNLGGGLQDFLATASAVGKMDLVISVDTSVAHLAGALAKPVWTLIQYSPDWRWFLDRADTPWYPTMRLFRQAQRNQWGPVVQQAAEALRRRLEEAGGRGLS